MNASTKPLPKKISPAPLTYAPRGEKCRPSDIYSLYKKKKKKRVEPRA